MTIAQFQLFCSFLFVLLGFFLLSLSKNLDVHLWKCRCNFESTKAVNNVLFGCVRWSLCSNLHIRCGNQDYYLHMEKWKNAKVTKRQIQHNPSMHLSWHLVKNWPEGNRPFPLSLGECEWNIITAIGGLNMNHPHQIKDGKFVPQATRFEQCLPEFPLVVRLTQCG